MSVDAAVISGRNLSLSSLESLEWEPFDIPGGTSPVSIHRLHSDPTTRAMTLVVRFPAGWQRPQAGSYSAAEEAYVLEGAIEINANRFYAGEWFHIPTGLVRHVMSSPDGAVVLARFDGPPRWTPEEQA